MITSKKKINFYHCDPAGILFYARLFEICHSVYEEMINSFELEENYWQNDDYVVPIVKCEAGFFKPIKPGEEITVELFVSQLKETSFELSYEIKNENDVRPPATEDLIGTEGNTRQGRCCRCACQRAEKITSFH